MRTTKDHRTIGMCLLGSVALAGCLDGPAATPTGIAAVAQADTDDLGKAFKEGADWAGAVTNYAGAVSLVISMFGDSPEDELHHSLAQLIEGQRAIEHLIYDATGWLESSNIENDAINVGTESYASRRDVATFGSVPPGSAVTYLNDSLLAIRHLANNERYWNRPFLDAATAGEWQSITAFRPPVAPGNLVWDPRWVLPAFMQAIPERISTIQAADPAHRLSSVTYAAELASYRDKLIQTKQELESHLTCGFQIAIDVVRQPVLGTVTYHVHAICGDPFSGQELTAVTDTTDERPWEFGFFVDDLITTGTFSVFAADGWGAYPALATVGTLRGRFWSQLADNGFLQTWMDDTLIDLRTKMRAQLGLFELQREIDALYTLLADAPGPITGGRLRSDLAGICLAHNLPLSGGLSVVSTAACDGPLVHTYGQTWTYEPALARFRSVDLGACLSVLGDPARPMSFTFVDACDDSAAAQRWSYDAESHRIRNADGYVLDIYNGTATPGANVWLYWDTGSVAQQWGFPSPWIVHNPPPGSF